MCSQIQSDRRILLRNYGIAKVESQHEYPKCMDFDRMRRDDRKRMIGLKFHRLFSVGFFRNIFIGSIVVDVGQ